MWIIAEYSNGAKGIRSVWHKIWWKQRLFCDIPGEANEQKSPQLSSYFPFQVLEKDMFPLAAIGSSQRNPIMRHCITHLFVLNEKHVSPQIVVGRAPNERHGIRKGSKS